MENGIIEAMENENAWNFLEQWKFFPKNGKTMEFISDFSKIFLNFFSSFTFLFSNLAAIFLELRDYGT